MLYVMEVLVLEEKKKKKKFFKAWQPIESNKFLMYIDEIDDPFPSGMVAVCYGLDAHDWAKTIVHALNKEARKRLQS